MTGSGFTHVLKTRVLEAVSPSEVLTERVILAVGEEGRIVTRAPEGSAAFDSLVDQVDCTLPDHCLLVPGLADLHIHAPQWPQAGKALDLPLEEWLGSCTFPLESRYADAAFAESVWQDLVPSLLRQGTTTALYFATIHEEASLGLARVCIEHGQRALVGLVAMDHPELCPADYRQASAQEAIDATRRFILAVRALRGNEAGLVQPVITPRFIPACTDALLKGLGELARVLDVRVQTHASESDWEHETVLARMGCSDVEALDRFGLLPSFSVLAHAGFTSRQDRALLRQRKAAIAHCPISNAFFAGAALPLRNVLDEQVPCGLGTDISGGYSASIFENARQAVLTSRILESGTDPDKPSSQRGRPHSRVSFAEAFWLATRGGAEALGLPCGQFQPGQMLDAVEMISGRGALRLHEEDSASTLAQKVVCHAGPETIGRVWVGGRLVVSGNENSITP
ncbi:amidohydrolase family protein [Acetobacter sp.]|uniref:amidohydrolase family protein n=1 Tax=Acetobacter sp. TaxID=440 RepID=UPI0039EAE79C